MAATAAAATAAAAMVVVVVAGRTHWGVMKPRGNITTAVGDAGERDREPVVSAPPTAPPHHPR